MEIIEEKQSGINIFKLNGRLDSNTSQGFEKKLFQALILGRLHQSGASRGLSETWRLRTLAANKIQGSKLVSFERKLIDSLTFKLSDSILQS